MDLGLLLSCEDDPAGYLKGGASLDQAQKGAKPGSVDDVKPVLKDLDDPNASPNNLDKQRWSVIVPEEGGDELFARMAKLVEFRQAEQRDKIQGDELGKPFKVPANMGYEDALRWIGEKLNPLPDWKRPRYLLMLGDPQKVSLELQHALSVYYFVGRLAFDNPDGYSSYAAKVLEAAGRRSDGRAVSFTVRSAYGDDAPDDGFRKLMYPAVDLSTKEDQRCPVPLVDTSPAPGMATYQSFLQVAADPRPTIMMSMSHGMGRGKRRPWTEEECRRFQGQMSFGYGKDPLYAEAVAKGDFLPYGFWFYFACFGAGTPGSSAYEHWLSQIAPGQDVLTALPQNATPFIAALPQAALANPRGPLGVVGHLDLAWSYSYDKALTNAVNGLDWRMIQLLQLAVRDKRTPYDHPNQEMAPHRFGAALRMLTGDLPFVQQTLANMYDDEEKAIFKKQASTISQKQRANLWMLRQDLRAYILLGDPAAHLPVNEEKERDVDLSLVMPYGVQVQVDPAAQALQKLDLDKVERSIIDCMAEQAAPGPVAKGYGLELNEFKKLMTAYSDAGRQALAKKLGKA